MTHQPRETLIHAESVAPEQPASVVYCLSQTITMCIFFPFAPMVVAVSVVSVPFFDTASLPVATTLPPRFPVNAIVFAFTRLNAAESKVGWVVNL